MNQAGRSLGRALLEDFEEVAPLPDDLRLLVLAGKGHNGGDALLAADEILRYLPDSEVTVVFVYGSKSLKPLVQRSLKGLIKVGKARVTVRSWSEDEMGELGEQEFDICIDGILGMQFKPPLRPPGDEAVNWVNGNPGIRLRAAVDLPSGVGDECAEEAFRADFTYATGIAKRPLFETGNAAAVGRIRYLDIGFFEEYEEKEKGRETILLPEVLDPLRGLRAPLTDKRSYGHLFVLGGSRSMPGAIFMAVRAALRSGVGLVTAFVPESVAGQFAAAVPEAMWVPWPETPDGGLALEGFHLLQRKLERATALLAGPGMGTEAETRTLLERVATEINLPLVFDADALQQDVIAAIKNRSGNFGGVIITPHLGEFRRVAGLESAEYEPEVLKTFCKENRLVTVLKGPVTRICDGAQIAHSTFGGPVLARGGSGDILCGLAGSMAARPGSDSFEAACRAVAWHGLAADALARSRGQTAVTTTEILDYLSPVLRDE